MTDMELLSLAEEARARAYAPYSGYRVGAAVLCADGRVYTGANIENASYGACLCAERAALACAVSDGNREIIRLAVAASGAGTCTPCGICRQVIVELAPESRVICGRREKPENAPDSPGQNDESAALEPVVFSIRELLPAAFDGDRLISGS